MTPRARISIQSPDEPAPLLLVSPYEDDHVLLPEILNHSHWEWHRGEHCRQALEILNEKAVTVVICERDQRNGSWRDLLAAGAKMMIPPSVIVCSRLADHRLWAEVLNNGGYDVLAKPFDREEVSRVAYLAWHSWKRRAPGSNCAAMGKPPSPWANVA